MNFNIIVLLITTKTNIMKNISGITRILLSLIVLLLVVTTSCQKEETEKAPVLPPESSFVMDFSDFMNTKTVSTQNTQINRTLAVAHVAVWNTVIFVNLAVPVATFTEAFNHEPQFQGNGSWKWSYSVNVGVNQYTADLVGTISGANVNWEMFVSKSGNNGFSNFLWYTGESSLDGKSGTWTLNREQSNPSPYIGIEWYKNSDEDFGITYTNIIPSDSENGGYISHGRDNNLDLNAFYEIFNKGQNNLVEIKWDVTSKEGKIKDPKFYGNDQFHCWATNGFDVVCE